MSPSAFSDRICSSSGRTTLASHHCCGSSTGRSTRRTNHFWMADGASSREELELLLPASDAGGRARRITLDVTIADGRRRKRFLATGGTATIRLKVRQDLLRPFGSPPAWRVRDIRTQSIGTPRCPSSAATIRLRPKRTRCCFLTLSRRPRQPSHGTVDGGAYTNHQRTTRQVGQFYPVLCREAVLECPGSSWGASSRSSHHRLRACSTPLLWKSTSLSRRSWGCSRTAHSCALRRAARRQWGSGPRGWLGTPVTPVCRLDEVRVASGGCGGRPAAGGAGDLPSSSSATRARAGAT